eukprot:135273-Alexandrium_andersonii.AAC.1
MIGTQSSLETALTATKAEVKPKSFAYKFLAQDMAVTKEQHNDCELKEFLPAVGKSPDDKLEALKRECNQLNQMHAAHMA